MQYNIEAIINPTEFLNYIAPGKNITCGKICIFCWNPSLLECLVKRTQAKEVADWPFQTRESRKLYQFTLNGRPVSLICLEIGATLCGMIMEILIACGVKSFLTISAAGSLQDNIKAGNFVIAQKAIRDEGVSVHYLEPTEIVDGDEVVLSALEKACQESGYDYHLGTTWTTGAIFREVREKVKSLKERGILTVEMETATLYSIAKYRGVRCGSLLYVTDSLSSLKWKPKPHSMENKAHFEVSSISLRAVSLIQEQLE